MSYYPEHPKVREVWPFRLVLTTTEQLLHVAAVDPVVRDTTVCGRRCNAVDGYSGAEWPRDWYDLPMCENCQRVLNRINKV